MRTQTLGGTGTVVFGNGDSRNTIRELIAGATLTLGSGITVRGKTGYIGYNPNIGGPTNPVVIQQWDNSVGGCRSNICCTTVQQLEVPVI